jgi:hypothetical protein
MTTNNRVNVPLSGQTGTGSFCGSNSPIISTPTLGAATATSIGFGGSALSTYVASTSWTPTFTFATVGDLSVAYNTQVGYYAQVGALVVATFNLVFTPTYTTASGNAKITLPLTVLNAAAGQRSPISITTITYPVGATFIILAPQTNLSNAAMLAQGTGLGLTILSATQFPTGTQYTIIGTAVYLSTN